jgi:hypothetical protein
MRNHSSPIDYINISLTFVTQAERQQFDNLQAVQRISVILIFCGIRNRKVTEIGFNVRLAHFMSGWPQRRKFGYLVRAAH